MADDHPDRNASIRRRREVSEVQRSRRPKFTRSSRLRNVLPATLRLKLQAKNSEKFIAFVRDVLSVAVPAQRARIAISPSRAKRPRMPEEYRSIYGGDGWVNSRSLVFDTLSRLWQ